MSEIWDKPITDNTDWGGDSSTNGLPVSGRQVQAWLKSRIAKILTEQQVTKIVEDWAKENGFVDDKGFVTLSSDQEVNGLKNFLQGLMVNGGLVTYDPTHKAWQLNGDLLVTGGISMFSSIEGYKPSTIMNAIVTDGVTIKVNDAGQLSVVKAGLDYEELDAYLRKNGYSTTFDIDARIRTLVDDAPAEYDTLGKIATILENEIKNIEGMADKTYVDDNFISRIKNDDVTAILNFLNGFSISGIPFRKTANGQLFIDANVVFGGGVTMYGTDSTPAPSIFDGLPIDGRTIKRDGNGALYVDETALSVSGGGGVADSVAWVNVTGKPSWITANKPQYTYSEILNTPDLSNYATKSWVEEQQYLTEITSGMIESVLGYQPYDGDTNRLGFLTSSALNGYATQDFVNTAVNGAKDWVEDQQYLTEITSGDIESVLGYQPYDGDTNRKGFLTASALTPYFLTSNFTKANIKSTLGISDWALASAKPTYTASEVGALGVNDTATNANKLGGCLPRYRQGEACIPAIESTGVMEIGKYIDFHTQDEEDGVDYSLRIECRGSYRNKIYFPTTNGTLALTSDIPSLNDYAMQSWVNTELLKYLPIAGGTINGSLGIVNQLTAGSIVSNGNTISIGGGKLYYNSSLQAWQLDGSLLVTGSISMYSTFDNFTPSDIFQGLPIDGKTIYWDNGVLKALGGGGGVADSVAWVNVTGKPTWITNKKPTYNYSEILNTPDLSVYALASSLANYALKSSIPTNNNQLSNGAGYITSSALNGYATETWVNTALSNYLPLSGGTVNGSITATGDLSANGMVRGTAYLSTGYMAITSNIDSSIRASIFGDADTHWGQIKMFRTGSGATGSYGSLAGTYAAGILFAMNDTHGFIQMPNSSNRAGEAVIGGGDRGKINWSAHLLHSLNYSSYALSLTGGTVNGNITATSFTQASQRSLKNILSYDGLSLEQLSVIKPIKFTWKDGRDNRYHVGGVADDMAQILPEVVYSTNDFLTMDYGNAGFYVAASLIKPVIYCYNKVEKHEKDIDYLKRENIAIKNENKYLRDEINQLKQAS